MNNTENSDTTPLDVVNRLTGPQEYPEGAQEALEDLQDPEGSQEDQEGLQEDQEDQEDPEGSQEDPDTFPRTYVEQLRKESANYRKSAESATSERDQLAQQLHTALVQLDGRLADPRDLPPLTGSDALEPDRIKAAISGLLSTRPRLAARALDGDIGQGNRGGLGNQVDLIELMRNA